MDSYEAKEKAIKQRCFMQRCFVSEEDHKLSDDLYRAAIAYRNLCQKEYCFTFSNGKRIRLVIFARNFVHLAGLRKLSDVNEFQATNSALNIFTGITRGIINDLHLHMSEHYDSDARDRIRNLSRIDELIHAKQAVWDFDNQNNYIQSNLKSKVILFKYDGFNFYLTLGLADNGDYYYPESFFLRYDDHYILNQNIVDIVQLTVTPIKRRKK